MKGKFENFLYSALLALGHLGSACIFLFEILRSIVTTRRLLRTGFRHLLGLLMRSILMMGCAAVCVGTVLSLQIYSLLEPYKATSRFPAVLGISLSREFAPVLTALLFIAMVGSAVTAEIALMKSSNQLDCLEVMAIDPIQWVFAPRFLAIFGLLPMLTQMFLFLALGSGAVMSIHYLGMDPGIFWNYLEIQWWRELTMCAVKSLNFAVAIGWIALFEGKQAVPNSEGIGKATTNSVVQSVLVILVLDVLLTIVLI